MPPLILLALAAGKRFLNGNLVLALAIAAAVTAIPLVVAWWHHDIKKAAVSDRDRTWSAALGKARAAETALRQRQAKAAEAAAEAERVKLRQERDDAAGRADVLETTLRALRRPDGRLIIYPKALVEELRK